MQIHTNITMEFVNMNSTVSICEDKASLYGCTFYKDIPYVAALHANDANNRNLYRKKKGLMRME